MRVSMYVYVCVYMFARRTRVCVCVCMCAARDERESTTRCAHTHSRIRVDRPTDRRVKENEWLARTNDDWMGGGASVRERELLSPFFFQTIGRQGTVAAAAANGETNDEQPKYVCERARARVCVCVRFTRVPGLEGRRRRRCAVCLPADDRRPRVEGVYHVTIEVPPPPPLVLRVSAWCSWWCFC